MITGRKESDLGSDFVVGTPLSDRGHRLEPTKDSNPEDHGAANRAEPSRWDLERKMLFPAAPPLATTMMLRT